MKSPDPAAPLRSPSARPIRVAFLIHTLQSGGAEGQLVEWLRALATAPGGEFEPRLYCLVSGGFHEAEVRRLGVPVEILGYRPMRRKSDGSLDLRAALTLPRAFARLLRALRRDRPAILQTLLLMSDFLGALATCALRHPPRLAGSRLALTDCARLGRWRAAALRWSVRRAGVILCNSRAVANDAIATQGADPARVAMIYNGVDVERFARAAAERERARAAFGFAPGETALGYVAQLRPEKGHRTLLEAFALLARERADLRLALVGSGPLEPELRALAARLGVESRVSFLGVRKEIPGFLAACDLAVHPSDTEGFSNTLLEAMAAGKPIAATRVGGNPEALAGGEAGLLVPPRDPAALAAALRRLLEDPAGARRLGAAAQARARREFSVETLHEHIRDFYRRVAAGEWDRRKAPPAGSFSSKAES